MKIAFFSYEYPPETGGGGIGTYLTQMVLHLPKYGHYPVVFCATAKQEAFWENENVYRIPAKNYETYNINLPSYFSTINKKIDFDIAEGTDFRACGIEVMKQFPNLPFVVRAHTANYIIDQFLYNPLTFKAKARFILGGLKKFQLPYLPKPPQECDYLIEKEIVSNCTELQSPSESLAKMYKQMGWVNNYQVVPFFYEPTPEILSVSSTSKNKEIKVVFYGRLEIRKGVLEIAKAMPQLLKKYPTLQFYFYGTTANSPISGIDMLTYLQGKLKKYTNNVFFKGAFKPEDISLVLQSGDIFLFPSRYDNAPLACFEGMAAGKSVIGSRNGGMAEIIEEGVSGLLVDSEDYRQIIEKVSLLVESDIKRISLGENARKRILNQYAASKNIPIQLKAYQQVIDKKQNEINEGT